MSQPFRFSRMKYRGKTCTGLI